jgi:ATP-dependent Clp protease protease subunit
MEDTLPAGWLFLGFNWAIDVHSVSQLARFIGFASQEKASGITIILNSLGGSPEHALYIASLIRGFNLPIHTHNASTVQSAANLVFLAGHRRTADPLSTFMFHKTVFNTVVGSLTPEQLALQVSGINNSDKITLDWLTERSAQPASVFENILTGDRLHSAIEAKSLGFVDSIRQLQIPANARFVQVTLDLPKS